MDEDKNFPTMIIPANTEISVNENGQLSIRTPGNLVIQNSGVYSVIESGSGSVRIDPGVKVEAVSVKASESCFVAGELTAWRVTATRITLEKGAQANIMLQESETLELDRNARLVGNFASERELYLMLGRFSRQLRSLPEELGSGDRERFSAAAGPDTDPFVAPDGEDEPSPDRRQEQQEVLSLVRVILERELGRPGVSAEGRSALERLMDEVRSGDLETLESSYRFQLSRIDSPSDDLDRARKLLDKLFS